jgi:hypothetical protein
VNIEYGKGLKSSCVLAANLWASRLISIVFMLLDMCDRNHAIAAYKRDTLIYMSRPAIAAILPLIVKAICTCIFSLNNARMSFQYIRIWI